MGGKTGLASLAIERLSAVDANGLGRFFEALQRDAESLRFFHPFPLTPAFAALLCARQSESLDRHYITRYHDRLAAYSMLRGWDEGYTIPSFGACTHPGLRNAGLGHWLLAHALTETRAAGAGKLRLTVYKENLRAIHLYRKFGFVFSNKNERELVGVLNLDSVLPCSGHEPDKAKLDDWLMKEASRQREEKTRGDQSTSERSR
jgi:GNAT superfamily N-acetyltransferase